MMQEMSAPSGGVGSSSVGSRLAGEEPPPSATNGSQSGDSYQPFGAPKQSPIYTPSAVKQSGFSNGNTGFQKPAAGASNLSMQAMTQTAMEKAEFLKSWSVKTYKCTKQILSERLGRGTKTVDVELEAKIEILRDTKRKYENLAAVSQALSTHISNMMQAQRVLSEAFNELSHKSNELKEEFRYNSDTQQVLVKNGESLLAAIQFFINGINTLCKKTMEDTLLTVTKYEQARVEFDAYRTELETLALSPRTAATVSKQGAAEVNFNKQKELYEKLRKDVGVKLQFLDENRVKVMQKHLLLFHNAVTAFFAGNQQMLEATLQQFSVAPKLPGQTKSSFLEKE
ncbi:arfaptin-2-like [Styela clava]